MAQILAGNGLRHLHDFLSRPLCHHIAPLGTGTGTDIYNMVCHTHGILVMLHHQQCIAHIAQILQRFQQFIIVTLMQPDAWLVKYIQYTYQP